MSEDQDYVIDTVADLVALLNTIRDLKVGEMYFIAKIDDELFCINKGSQRHIAEMLILMATEDPALAKIIKTAACLVPSGN